MMTLLHKEILLVAHPTSIVFALLGCLVLVPAYPYSVIFMFGCLAAYITFLNARETNDVWYTAVLPVTKRESVLGKCLLVVFFQLFQLLFSIPFAILRSALKTANNPVGLDATVAWYGFGLILYAVFDFVFLTAFYKNAYQIGKSFVLAAIPMIFLMVATESTAYIPALVWMDSCQPEHLLMQLPILLIGILCYTLLVPLAYRISAKRFTGRFAACGRPSLRKAFFAYFSRSSLFQTYYTHPPVFCQVKPCAGEWPYIPGRAAQCGRCPPARPGLPRSCSRYR